MARYYGSILLSAGLATAAWAVDSQDYPYRPVSFTEVKLTDSFWQPRIETNRTVTVPFAFEQCERTGRIENFKVAGGLSDRPWTGKYGFNDSDVSKVLEGTAYCLNVKKDLELEKCLDDLISWYAAAQEEDGFLYTWWTAGRRKGSYVPAGCTPRVDRGRWDNLSHAHQLYNVGHMYEAGVAHYLATGKRSLLDICIRNADLICETFAPEDNREVPGHQEIEIGLVKLYRVTGDRKYLEQAKRFLDRRGQHGNLHSELKASQNHLPVLEQNEAVGHAVRANYMYCAMADVAALTGDPGYLAAVDRLWEDVVSTKIYVTGGTGARARGEAYGDRYELPNAGYCETCAAIAVVYWNHRMFMLHGDAKYIDVLERALYNNVLSGLGMDGKHFFYGNRLTVTEHGDQRKKWFGCACCPSNLTRFIASIGGYMYAVRDKTVYVNLYGQSDAKVKLADRTVGISQTTGYPWNGDVRITVSPNKAGRFSLKLRIPGWAAGRLIPGDLYTVAPGSTFQWEFSCKVNGEDAKADYEAGYAVLDRNWQEGDFIEVTWPMVPLRVLCHEAVEPNRGRIALQRGPIVYCVEGLDVRREQEEYHLPDNAVLRAEHRADLLNGVTVIKLGDNGFAIPYYARSHRGNCWMDVWIARGPVRNLVSASSWV